ncbi:MAG: GTPase Era [Clostridia bacterium]|nr:GTPase Era [Clostridia bacterium]
MKSGTVAVIGRANAGKSTLVNVLVGEKVSITSPKPQTTRDRIYGILTTEDYQIVFEDTPGIYKATSALNKRMQRTTRTTAKDVDLILYLIDGHDGVKDEDLQEAAKVSEATDAPFIAVLTKTDIMPKENIPSALSALSAIVRAKEIIPVSARRGTNIKELLGLIIANLPEGEYLFSPDVVSDKSERFMLAEIMREKILLKFDKEIPHGVAVVVNDFSKKDNGVYNVDLDIVCEKQNHKAILIGKNGGALKEVNKFARESMEKFLGGKVFLTSYVKVKENWRDRPDLLKLYGYSSEDAD